MQNILLVLYSCKPIIYKILLFDLTVRDGRFEDFVHNGRWTNPYGSDKVCKAIKLSLISVILL